MARADALESQTGFIGTYKTTAKWTVKDAEGKERVESASGTFIGPASAETLVSYYQSLKADEQSAFLEAWFYGADLKKKGGLRPAVSAESPWVSRDGVKINLSTGDRIDKEGVAMKLLPIEKCIGAVNAGFDDANMLEQQPKAAFVVARKMLLEAKKAIEKDGRLVVRK